MKESQKTPWKRLLGLLDLERKDIFQIFYYAIFSGLVSLSLPLGIQAIINLIQDAQISTSCIVLVILVTVGVVFSGNPFERGNSKIEVNRNVNNKKKNP